MHNPYTNTSFLTIAAGPLKYALFNQTQCEFSFFPRQFLVSVNTTARTILRTPLNITTANLDSPPPSLDPVGHLPANVIRTINLLSRMKSSLCISELGETLLSALKSYTAAAAATNTTTTTTSSLSDAVLPMTSQFFTSMADHILGAYATSQIFIANDTQPLQIVTSSCRAVRLGSNFYIFIVLGLNLAVVALLMAGLVLTMCWRNLPSWDSRSIRDLVVASMGMRDWPVSNVEACSLMLVPQDDGGGWHLEASSVAPAGGKPAGKQARVEAELLPQNTVPVS